MQLDLKNCVITVKDGSATPKTAELKPGEGDFAWTEHSGHDYKLNRGKLDEVKLADEQPLDINSAGELQWYTDDVLKILRGDSGFVSTDTDQCRPYCCDIEVVHTVVCGTVTTKETYLFKYFRMDENGFALKDGTFSLTGRCNILRPTVTKTTTP